MTKKTKKILDKWFGIGRKRRESTRPEPEYKDEEQDYYDEDDDYDEEERQALRDRSVTGRLEALRRKIVPNEPSEADSSLEVKKLAAKVGFTLPAGAAIVDQIEALEMYYYGTKVELPKEPKAKSIDVDLVMEMAKQLGLRTVPGDSADKVLEGIERALKMDTVVQKKKGFESRVAEAYVEIYG